MGEVIFVSRHPDEYFITVAQNEAVNPVPYTLSVVSSDQRDKVGETPEYAADIQIDDLVQSDIGLPYDADLFRFQAVAGHAYQIDFSITGGWNPEISILYLDDGNLTLRSKFDRRYYHWRFSGDHDDDAKRQLSGVFVAQESGDTYLIVRGRSPVPKNRAYQFTVKPLQSLIDTDVSIELSIGQAHQDNIDYVEDEDFFHFNAEEGKNYLIQIEFPFYHDPVAEVWFDDASEWDRKSLYFPSGHGPKRAEYQTRSYVGKYSIRVSDMNRADYTITVNEVE